MWLENGCKHEKSDGKTKNKQKYRVEGGDLGVFLLVKGSNDLLKHDHNPCIEVFNK